MRTACWLLAAAVACAGVRPANQSPFGGIAGSVVDATSGEPLRAVLVRFRGSDDLYRGALTDAAGEFTFGPLDPGTHEFTVESPGYRMASAQGIRVEAGHDTTVQIRLTPTDPADPASAGVQLEPPVLLTPGNFGYPTKAWGAEVEGLLVVRCTVTREGRVTRCTVLRDLPYMAEKVIEALEQRRYRPAARNGEPIEVSYTFKMNFTLR